MEGDDGPATRLCCQLPEMATTQYFKQVVNPRLCFSSVVVFTCVESSGAGGRGWPTVLIRATSTVAASPRELGE